MYSTGRIPHNARMTTHRNDLPHPVAAIGAVVFHQGAVLLVKRGKPPALGEWAIPGGKIHLGESLQQAAEREIREETGITIRAGQPVFAFDLLEQDDSGQLHFHYIIVDVEAEYVSGTLQAADDAMEARWVNQEEILHLKLNHFTRRLLCEKYRFI